MNDMYESPINLIVTNIYNQMMEQQENEIYKAVLHYVPDVDKEELIRALRYDREQYSKGYADGRRDAEEKVVRCKDCKHWYDREGVCLKIYSDGAVSSYAWQFRKPDDFCSYGERKDGE